MNLEFDWERLEEPTPRELALLDKRAWEILQEKTSEEEVERLARTPYLKELADFAYIDLLNALTKFQKERARKVTSDEFNEYRVRAIFWNMPIKTRTCDRKSYREVFSAIASNLGKMLAEARKRKLERKERTKLEQRMKSPEQKKAERDLKKAKWSKAQQEARDAIEHGPRHSELILAGIRMKRPPPPSRRSRGKFVPRVYKTKPWKPATHSYAYESEDLPLLTAAQINELVRNEQERFEKNELEFPGKETPVPKTITMGFLEETPRKRGRPRKNWRKEIS
jgi:hypothetical protein